MLDFPTSGTAEPLEPQYSGNACCAATRAAASAAFQSGMVASIEDRGRDVIEAHLAVARNPLGLGDPAYRRQQQPPLDHRLGHGVGIEAPADFVLPGFRHDVIRPAAGVVL